MDQQWRKDGGGAKNASTCLLPPSLLGQIGLDMFFNFSAKTAASPSSLLPSAAFNSTFAKKNRIRMKYSASFHPPSISNKGFKYHRKSELSLDDFCEELG
jgi:hypothetical protein